MEYHVSFAARARDLCYLGATNAEIAALLGVSTATLIKWRQEYPEFDYAWKDGVMHANAKVAGALFKRATGYEYVKWKETKDGKFKELVHVVPDVAACVFWLTNKRPGEWQSRVEHAGANSGNIPQESWTDVETARRIAYALAKAMHTITENKERSIEHDGYRPATSETE